MGLDPSCWQEAAQQHCQQMQFPRQHRPKDLGRPQRCIHLIEIKYCVRIIYPIASCKLRKEEKNRANIAATFKALLLFCTPNFSELWVGGTIYNTR
jgi:hypothetical protein